MVDTRHKVFEDGHNVLTKDVSDIRFSFNGTNKLMQKVLVKVYDIGSRITTYAPELARFTSSEMMVA